MSLKSLSELELIQRLKAGNSEAVKELYQIAFHYCAGFILKNTGNQEDARGIFQEALIVLYKNLRKPDFTIESDLKFYLYGVVRNLWLTHLRKAKKTGLSLTLDKDNKHLEIAHDQESLNEKIDQEKQLQYLEDQLRNHSEECRKLLRLFFYEKKKYREVAPLMNYTEAYVRKKKMKCIDALRRKFLNLQSN